MGFDQVYEKAVGRSLRGTGSLLDQPSGNDLVRRFIDKADKITQNEIVYLISGEVIEKAIRLDLTYNELDASIANLWSVLFNTGYLTQTGSADKYVVELSRACLRYITAYVSS